MPDWQERITRETEPAIRAEHDLRYQLVVGLLGSSSIWADLGCGTGLAAAAAIDGSFSGRAVLVDREADLVAAAAREIGTPASTELVADLDKGEDIDRVRRTLSEVGRGEEVLITCFEVIEHLNDFEPLLRLLVELAEDGVATTVLSVPNDAFWANENPYHATVWGEGAFAELRALVPQTHLLAHQVSVHGSAVLRDGSSQADLSMDIHLDAENAVPTHYLLAIGPRADQLGHGALAVQTDLGEQRRWERKRESYNAYLEAELDQARADLRSVLAERDQLAAIARRDTAKYDEWREYIHDLERQLGLPPSGSPARAEHDARALRAERTPHELPAPDLPRTGAPASAADGSASAPRPTPDTP